MTILLLRMILSLCLMILIVTIIIIIHSLTKSIDHPLTVLLFHNLSYSKDRNTDAGVNLMLTTELNMQQHYLLVLRVPVRVEIRNATTTTRTRNSV